MFQLLALELESGWTRLYLMVPCFEVTYASCRYEVKPERSYMVAYSEEGIFNRHLNSYPAFLLEYRGMNSPYMCTVNIYYFLSVTHI